MPTVQEILSRSRQGGPIVGPPTPAPLIRMRPPEGVSVQYTPIAGLLTPTPAGTPMPGYNPTIVPVEALPRDPATGLPTVKEAILNPDQEWIDKEQLSAEMRGPLGKVLDFLNIGLYPTANVVKYILEGRTDLATAFWRGLTLEEKTTFTDILEKYHVPGAPIIGFVLDNALDVNTYINYGIPVLMKLGKIALGAVKNAKWVDEAIDIIKQNSVLHWIDDAFGTTITRSKAFREYKEAKLFRTAAMTAEKRAVYERVRKYVMTIPNDVLEQMSYFKEHPERLDEFLLKLKPDQQEAFSYIADQFGRMLDESVQMGLLAREAADSAKVKYFPHRFVALEHKSGSQLVGPLFTPSFAKRRSFHTLEDIEQFITDMRALEQANTLEEAVQIAQAKGLYEDYAESILKQGDLDLVKKWSRAVQRAYTPVKNYAVAYGLYANEFITWKHKKLFLDEVLSKFGKKVSMDIEIPPEGYGFFLPKGNLAFFEAEVAKTRYKMDEAAKLVLDMLEQIEKKGADELIELSGDFVRKIVGVTTNVPVYILEKDIARDLNNTMKFFVGDSATSSLLRFYDKALGVWKSLATSWRLVFHVRNAITNPILMWLGGVNPTDLPELAVDAGQIMLKTDNVVRGTGMTAKELYDVAEKLGTIKTGFFGTTAEELVMRLNEFYTGKLRNRLASLLELPNQAGAAIENHARLMMFVDGLRKGLDPREATKRVWRYLFNYDDITPFEINLKRVVPFYTWLRKNLPLQLQVLATEPRKFAQVHRAFSMMDRLANLTYEDVATTPDWFHKLGYVKLPFKTQDGRQLWAYIDVPMKDLNLLANPLEILNSLTPAIGLVMAAAGGKPYPIYTPREAPQALERFPGELEPAPAFAAWLPEELQRFLGLQPMLDKKTGKLTLGWPRKAAAIVQTLLPPLRELNEMTKDWFVDVEPNDAPWRRLSFLTGIRFTPVSRQEQLYYWWLDQQDKASAVVKRMYQLGRALTKEELEAILKR